MSQILRDRDGYPDPTSLRLFASWECTSQKAIITVTYVGSSGGFFVTCKHVINLLLRRRTPTRIPFSNTIWVFKPTLAFCCAKVVAVLAFLVVSFAILLIAAIFSLLSHGNTSAFSSPALFDGILLDLLQNL